MKSRLVVGCGNSLRGDDGAGLRAVELLAARFPALACVAVHQLHVELAELVSQHAEVIFVDAGIRTPHLTISRVEAGPAPRPPDSHLNTPEAILRLSRELYGRAPRAWQVELPAHSLEFAETLTPQTARVVEEFVGAFSSLFGNVPVTPGDR